MVLEEAESRPALLVERHDLAVDDRLLGSIQRRWRGEIGEVVAASSVARPDAHPAIAHDRLHPIAVPLDLEQPIGVVNGCVARVAFMGGMKSGMAPRWLRQVDLARRLRRRLSKPAARRP